MIYTSSKSTLGAHWRVTALVIHVKDSKEKVGFNLESARTFFIELLGIDGRRPRENTFVCKSSNNYSGQHREEWGGGNRWSTHRRVNAHRHCVAATVAVASTPLSLLMLWFFVGLPAHLSRLLHIWHFSFLFDLPPCIQSERRQWAWDAGILITMRCSDTSASLEHSR